METPPSVPPEPPPLPSPPEEPEPDSGGAVALRVIAGLVVYAICGSFAFQSKLGWFPLLAVMGAAVYCAINHRARGFALGVSIGVGLTLLVFGACYVLVSNM